MSSPQKTVRMSTFRDPKAGPALLERWNERVQTLNGRAYQALTIETSFGPTRVWAHHPDHGAPPTPDNTLVFLPGARTCGLFWDLDHTLAPLKDRHHIYILEVVGQPGLSSGHCPDIKSNEYGVWAEEVFKALNISQAPCIGASQGALIILKLCLQAPDRVSKVVMMNPGGIQAFSMKPKNLFYNFLPIVMAGDGILRAFFDKIVLHPPSHVVSPAAYELMMDYMRLALRDFKFAGDYPEPLRADELKAVPHEIHLVLGDQDLLFPTAGTLAIAKAHFQNLKSVTVLPGIGHGIETSPKAIEALQKILVSS